MFKVNNKDTRTCQFGKKRIQDTMTVSLRGTIAQVEMQTTHYLYLQIGSEYFN